MLHNSFQRLQYLLQHPAQGVSDSTEMPAPDALMPEWLVLQQAGLMRQASKSCMFFQELRGLDPPSIRPRSRLRTDASSAVLPTLDDTELTTNLSRHEFRVQRTPAGCA